LYTVYTTLRLIELIIRFTGFSLRYIVAMTPHQSQVNDSAIDDDAVLYIDTIELHTPQLKSLDQTYKAMILNVYKSTVRPKASGHNLA
jgi:hypothetical protein